MFWRHHVFRASHMVKLKCARFLCTKTVDYVEICTDTVTMGPSNINDQRIDASHELL